MSGIPIPDVMIIFVFKQYIPDQKIGRTFSIQTNFRPLPSVRRLYDREKREFDVSADLLYSRENFCKQFDFREAPLFVVPKIAQSCSGDNRLYREAFDQFEESQRISLQSRI
jgi:hypothetical protein